MAVGEFATVKIRIDRVWVWTSNPLGNFAVNTRTNAVNTRTNPDAAANPDFLYFGYG